MEVLREESWLGLGLGFWFEVGDDGTFAIMGDLKSENEIFKSKESFVSCDIKGGMGTSGDSCMGAEVGS